MSSVYKFSLLCALFAFLPEGETSLSAASYNEEIAQSIAPSQRRQLEQLTALQLPSLSEIAAAVSPETLNQEIENLNALGSFAIGVRPVDEEGRSPIHHYLLNRIDELKPYGIRFVGSLKASVAAPVRWDNLLNPDQRGEAPFVQVAGESLPVQPLWPNGAIPSITPKEGIRGHLVDVRNASWDNLRDLPMDGAIAIMDFAGGRLMERLFSLGVVAVIVAEDDFINFQNARLLFQNTPLPFPRFFADAVTTDRIRSILSDAVATNNPHPEAFLLGGNLYENRPVESIFAYLPPSAPVTFQVNESSLLELIAADYGLRAEELLTSNNLQSPRLEAGQSLIIPGGRGRYQVQPGDLLQRLARIYSNPLVEVRRTNNLTSDELVSGTVLTFPNHEGPLTLVVPIDSTSVVPDAPHGAKVMANLAAALRMLDHLATSRYINRRRGLLIAFTDGDTLAGTASRTLAEYTFLLSSRFSTGSGRTTESQLDWYQASLPWFLNGTPPENNLFAQRLVEDWVGSRIEIARVDIAERRIPLVIGLNVEEDETQKQELRAKLADIEAELAFLVQFRTETTEIRGSHADRLRAYYAKASGPQVDPRVVHYGLDIAYMQKRFESELAEEVMRLAHYTNNLDAAAKIAATINTGTGTGTGSTDSQFRLGWYMDLSGGSSTLGIAEAGSGDFEAMRGGLRIGTQRIRMGSRLRILSAYASNTAGWEDDFTFVALEDDAVYSGAIPRQPGVYDEFWAFSNVALLPIGPRNDRLAYLDTPWDTLDRISLNHLSIQSRTFLTLLKTVLESPSDAVVEQNINKPELGRVTGKTVQFNIRSGIDAQDPIPGTYVFMPFGKKDSHWGTVNANAHQGFRRSHVMISMLNGGFVGPVEDIAYHTKPKIYAFRIDRDRGIPTKVMNQGQVGTRLQETSFVYRRQMETEKNLVMIDAYPLVIFPGPDPHELLPVGGQGRAIVPIDLVDAVMDGEPRNFGLANPFGDFHEMNTDSVVVFMPEGKRVRVIVQRGLNYRMLLVGEVEVVGGRARGKGHLVGPHPDGSSNLYLPLTPISIAREMLALAQHKLSIYERYGISSQMLNEAVGRSAELHAQAEQALEIKDYQAAIGLARESWGILVKNYPRILKLGREAVFSSIMLMALLVPGAYFLEKLLVGSKGIVKQLTWTTAIFTLGTLFLNAFHPAFRIAVSPFIVVIAFVMILMSVIVLAICYQRFEVILQRARAAGGEIEGEEISLMSSLGTALSLGVSNLKKRMFRTVLTTITVTALTFSIVAFVAVTGSDTVVKRPVPLDTFLDGEQIEPIAPKYEGIFFRNYQWLEMTDNLSVYETEYGRKMEITARAHYIQAEGGNNAFREGVNQIPLRYSGRTHVATGIMAFMPNEKEFSHLHEAVSGNQWFRDSENTPEGILPGDRRVVIIPDVAAATLGITPDMLLDGEGNRLPADKLPEITMRGRTWQVIGILDTEHANRIRDINGRSMAMIDYLRSGFSPAISGKLEDEGESYHMNWEDLVIIPFGDRNDVDAKMRSVAIKFPEDLDKDRFFKDVALRIKNPFFAYEDGEASFIVPIQKVNMAGVAKVFLPVILCVLIVMNTMLGAVDERKGEVSMLGAIGLSPKQISFLMLSEATVFSILGILFGTFGGLAFANLMLSLNNAGYSILSGLSFNFTSMMSMVLAAATGIVVLLATLIPAGKAAAMAAPSGMSKWELPPTESDGKIRFELPFTLTRGNAIGMAAFFQRFLLNHSDSTSEDFNARDIQLIDETAKDGQPGLRITTLMWLTPYDLDVSQTMTMRFIQTETEGVFAVRLLLERHSGTEDNWLRTNYNYLNLVRQQFLLWRNLPQQSRKSFIDEGINAITSKS